LNSYTKTGTLSLSHRHDILSSTHLSFISIDFRVDGFLFVNLEDDDWEDMGIINKFHIRKLQLIMKAFRIRYQRKKDKVEVDEDDDLLSEYSPSELSEKIAQEDMSDDEDEASLQESQVNRSISDIVCDGRDCG